MTRQVLQLRRGSQTEIATFTGAIGEVTVDTTRKTLVVHDGTTVGGSALATLASPTFTGTVIAPTPLTSDNSTKVATTAYVVSKIAGLTYPSVNSDAVTEGSTNLYFTNTRARAAISVSGNLSYSGGVISYTQPTALSAFTNDVGYLTNASLRGQLSGTGSINYNQSTGEINYVEKVSSVNGYQGDITLTSTDITEGTRLYYTDSRARNAVTSGTGITVNNTSGVISLTNTSVTVNGRSLSLLAGGTVTLTTDNVGQGTTNLYYADTLARSAVSASTGLSYTSSTGVFTIDATATQNFAALNVDTNTLVVDKTNRRVGIKNASPAYALDVSGDINFTGALRINGSVGTSGYVLSTNGTSAVSWASLTSVLPNITELDDLTYYFDGGTYTFTPTNNGNAVTITAPIALQAALNGVSLQPYINKSSTLWQSGFGGYGDYTIDSAGNIVFASPPQPGDKLVARVLVGNVSNPIDKTYPYRAIDITTGF